MTTAVATYRSNHVDYTADSTRSPKTVNTVITQINNQFVTQKTPRIQEKEVMPSYGGGSEKCARCSKTVYLAEKKVGAGHSFHISCFSCQTCHRKLESTTLCEHKGEIYCKTCYTRNFGVHGVANGISVTTETTVRESRPVRRSSYGCDLDTPVITNEQRRSRALSTENILRAEHSAVRDDELPKKFPWRNDVMPDQYSPTIDKIATEFDQIVDNKHQRPTSQIGFQKATQPTIDDNNHRQSTINRDDGWSRYNFDNQSTNYGNRTSALVDLPIAPSPKQTHSIIERIQIPLLPANDDEYTKDQSPIQTNFYRRQSSREPQVDLSDNFSRLSLNDDQQDINNQKHSNDNNTPTKLISENPLIKPTYSHSSSYETKQISSTKINFHSDENYSRDSSPLAAVNSNRSPSPTSGYASSSIYGEGGPRDSTSPPSVTTSNHDYLNTRSSNSSVIDRNSASPRQSQRTSSALHEFVARANIPVPTTTDRNSTISALVQAFRPVKDDFEN